MRKNSYIKIYLLTLENYIHCVLDNYADGN